MNRSWKGLLASLLLVAVLTLLGGWLARRVERERLESSVRMAWEVRRGDELARALDALRPSTAEERPLDRAHRTYLAGDFEACISALEGLEEDRLRADAELGFLFDLPWPRRAVAWGRIDLDQDGIRELLRAVDPGLGRTRKQELQLYRWSQNRYKAVALQVLRPAKGKLEPVEATRIEELDLGGPAAGCFSREGLWVVRRHQGAYAAFFFRSATPVTVEEGTISTSEGRWRWLDGQFKAEASPE
ncbi:MAG: hypothetical protein HY319_24645 [Armatimonadetes bacterium]|nr:hypothetical protein [Armatimonadota bacterium]